MGADLGDRGGRVAAEIAGGDQVHALTHDCLCEEAMAPGLVAGERGQTGAGHELVPHLGRSAAPCIAEHLDRMSGEIGDFGDHGGRQKRCAVFELGAPAACLAGAQGEGGVG